MNREDIIKFIHSSTIKSGGLENCISLESHLPRKLDPFDRIKILVLESKLWIRIHHDRSSPLTESSQPPPRSKASGRQGNKVECPRGDTTASYKAR